MISLPEDFQNAESSSSLKVSPGIYPAKILGIEIFNKVYKEEKTPKIKVTFELYKVVNESGVSVAGDVLGPVEDAYTNITTEKQIDAAVSKITHLVFALLTKEEQEKYKERFRNTEKPINTIEEFVEFVQKVIKGKNQMIQVKFLGSTYGKPHVKIPNYSTKYPVAFAAPYSHGITLEFSNNEKTQNEEYLGEVSGVITPVNNIDIVQGAAADEFSDWTTDETEG